MIADNCLKVVEPESFVSNLRLYSAQRQQRSYIFIKLFVVLFSVSTGFVAGQFYPKINLSKQEANNDMDLVKQILKGLVPEVEAIKAELITLKSSSEVPTDIDANYLLNKPLKVTSEKAYIRESANKDSKSLMIVAKDTVLFTEKIEGDWYEVILPVGGKGFIHKTIAEILDSKAIELAQVKNEKANT